MNERKWNTNYLDLVESIGAHGHSNVPYEYKRNIDLGKWVVRLRKKKGAKITGERIHLLNQIDFNWDASENEFNFYFSKLVKYKAIHGYVYIGKDVDDEQFHCLKHWVNLIRRAYKSFSKGQPQKLLTTARVMMLDDIGFQWTIDDAKWMKKYQDLVAYYEIFGDCAVPRKFDNCLFGFVNIQRRDFRNRFFRSSDNKEYGITDKRILLLKKINFDFKVSSLHPSILKSRSI